MLNKLSARVSEYVLDDDEDWEDSAYSRVLLALTGALIARMGFSLWISLEPGSVLGFIAIFGAFALASQLMVFAATGLDLEEWGRWVALAVTLGLTIIFLAATARGLVPALGTDAMAFSAYSAELVTQFQNPYTASMEPALSASAREFSTPRIDGSNVRSLSYPAGAVLAFVPQEVTVGGELRYTTLATVVATAGYLTYAMEEKLALAGVVSLVAMRNIWRTALGGVFDILWILPVLVSMQLFWQERYRLAAVPFALACTVKQIPWVIGPFLAIWLYKEAESRRAFGRTAGACLAIGLSVFGFVNLPFIVADPSAWLAGVLTPVAGAAPLVHQGVGLANLTTLGLLPLATWWHGLAVLATVISLSSAYWLYFDKLRWAAWMFPMFVWLVHYRSLTSYFVSFTPIAIFAIALASDQVRWAVSDVIDPAEEAAQEGHPC